MIHQNINLFHSDKFTLQISNIPTLTDVADLYLFENMMSSISIPAFGLTIDNSDFESYQLRQFISPEINRNLADLAIAFKLSAAMRNYRYLFQWIKNVRNGDGINTKSGFLKDYVISTIRVGLLDNVKIPVGAFIFKNCKISGLSGIDLRNGVADEVLFTASFTYENLDWDDVDPNEPA